MRMKADLLLFCISSPQASAASQSNGSGAPSALHSVDLDFLQRASDLALTSCGETQPHPNAACILTDPAGNVVGEASLWAQGTEAPELAATRDAAGRAADGTAYLNLETGDCHGDAAGIRALLHSGVSRVVIGMRHPLPVLRGHAVDALRAAGVHVSVLNEATCAADADDVDAALRSVLSANEPLLHRAAFNRPLGVLKYAMTLDGKIAASSGHSAWVSSKDSRQIVFATRSRSDAVIVGGQTVRRDNPRLTTRREGGHQPVRIVMSRTLDLPNDAALWDISHAPTIVATQRGARRDFQRMLRSRGVEVLEFDFLTPDAVAEYCYQRGFLACLWECGGMLSAPAISGGAIHKVMAFIAPKIIGGTRAPTPVGELGFVEMTQALDVVDHRWTQVGPDLCVTGYLPKSGGPLGVAALLGLVSGASNGAGASKTESNGARAPATATSADARKSSSGAAGSKPRAVEFYKSWDSFGSLSNFTAHAIAMPEEPMTHLALETFRPAVGAAPNPAWKLWPSTEHYYQAQKFFGVDHPDARALVEDIAACKCPEHAAAMGRRNERTRPELLREDWCASKTAVMHAALRAKYAAHAGPRDMLLSTAASGAEIVEAAPHDFFWGRGVDGSGMNMLGKLLVTVRAELKAQEAQAAAREQELRGAAQR